MIEINCPACGAKIKVLPFVDTKCCKISFFFSLSLIRILNTKLNVCILSSGKIVDLNSGEILFKFNDINYNNFIPNLNSNYKYLDRVCDNISFR